MNVELFEIFTQWIVGQVHEQLVMEELLLKDIVNQLLDKPLIIQLPILKSKCYFERGK